MTNRYRVSCAVAIVVALLALPALGDKPATRPSADQTAQAERAWAMGDFLRFTDGGPEGSSLDTSVVTFSRRSDGARVHLVSAVHIGERAYYDNLAADFETCDAVLYEMVKSRHVPVPAPGAHSDSSVARLQRLLRDVLELDYQLDAIDYRQRNFIHADLDAETFEELQTARGESMATLMLQQLMQALQNPQASQMEEQVNMLDLMTRPDGTRQIKTLLARQFGQIEEEVMALGGPESVILTERNKAAMKALNRVLRDGKREIAVFYGAAHMPDIAEQVQSMGFEPIKTEWRMAWDLAIRPGAPSAFERIMKHLNELQQQPQP